jgi:hypothetical protein
MTASPAHPHQFAAFPEEPVLWYFATSFDAESWGGKKRTREDAIEAARHQLFDMDDGVPGFWLVSGRLKLPEAKIDAHAIDGILQDIEDQECWWDDCGIDPRGCSKEMDDTDGLRTFLQAALGDWMSRNVDISCNRMIEDFDTMDYYRRVRIQDAGGLDQAELRPKHQAGDNEDWDGPEIRSVSPSVR